MHVHSLIQEHFHLLLQERVKLSLELLFLLLCAEALMVNLLVVLFDGKSENGLLKLLSQRDVKLRGVEFNQELFSSLFPNLFHLMAHLSCILDGTSGSCSINGLRPSSILTLEHPLVLNTDFLNDAVDGSLVVFDGVIDIREVIWHVLNSVFSNIS